MKKLNVLTTDEKSYVPQFESFDTAIQTIELYKRYRKIYGTKVVLNGLNLKCYVGQLYILYGTASSGKSAIVKSVLNLETFNRGVVTVFGQYVSESDEPIGYMPQLSGLDNNLTIQETLSYFAILQGMNTHECIKNFSDLQSPMTMNSRSVTVGTLSRDQKCVLSFYIAIMASPKLMVFDQPVAGCDPIYKNFLWQKMRSMVDNEGATIFITCSDEIDAKYADVIGFLRNGQIIAEDSAISLMKKYNITSFNDLVLSISLAELQEIELVQSEITPTTSEAESIRSGGFTITKVTLLDNVPQNTNHTNRMLLKNKINMKDSIPIDFEPRPAPPLFDCSKDFKQFWTLIEWRIITAFRNSPRRVFHFLLPLLCIIFYTLAVGSDVTDVRLGIVHCAYNDKMQCFRMKRPLCVTIDRISDTFIKKHYYENYDDASKDAANGKLSAILVLDEKSLNTKKLYNQEFGCRSTALLMSNVVLEMEASSKLIRSHIIDQVSRSYSPNRTDAFPIIDTTFVFNAASQVDCLMECPVSPIQLKFRRHAIAKRESEVIVLIWGAVATITHFAGALMGALPLCVHNRHGLLDRMKKIGISHFKLQLVHWTTRTILILIQCCLILVCTILIMQVDFMVDEFLIGWLVLTLQSLCGFSLGILLFGILGKKVPVIMYAVILELIVSAMSGFFWNYHSLTPTFQKITVVLPHYAVSSLLYKVIVQDINVCEDNIWIAFLIPIFWMVSTYVVYWIHYHLKK